MDIFKTDSFFRSVTRRSFMKLMGCAGLGSAGLLPACDVTAAKENKKVPKDRPSIPPIDLAVPPMVETATFSLG